ncbi:MAG: ATPase, T2SS/T4P/T4SS family [Candidatus Andersenbacteria bacterium]
MTQIGDAILQNLIEKQLLKIEDVAAIKEEVQTKGDLRIVLVDSKRVDEEEFTKAHALSLQMPYINLKEMIIPKDALSVIPESTARGHLVIAYEQTADTLKVAMANPNDRQIVEFIHKKVDKTIEVALASTKSIREALTQYQETLETELQNLVDEARGAIQINGDLAKAAEDLPTIKITEAILKHAIFQGASDIHIEPTETKVVIRYRIDGMLHDVLVLPKAVIAGIVARIKVLSSLKIDEHRLPQDGRFKLESDDYKVAFRVSTLPVFDGEKVVMRLLDESGHGLGLDDIGIQPQQLKIFRNSISKPHGMVLVTGPTGSGKTTTLYAAMRELNQPEVNISTVEDPIEYRMERINQTQVQPQIGLTFSNGLRALVRQDPDIIMVGEIRDEETAALAVNASLTGHLVLSTLHTNSAAGAIPRLVDMKIEPFLIASTVNLLLAQRLVRRLCKDCRQEVPIDKIILDSIAVVTDIEELLAVLKREKVVEEGVTWETIKIYQPKGCKKCTNGYKGRLGIYEMMEATPSIQKLITGNVTAHELEAKAREEQQMVSMVEDGIIKVINGVTSIEEVLRVAKE